MKTKPVVVRKLSTLLFSTLMAAPLVTLAQPTPGENPENRPTPQRGPAFQDRIVTTLQRDDIGVIRVLTEEQRTSFRQAMESQRDQTRAIEEKIRAARKEAIAAGLAEKFDEDAVRQKALEVGKLEAELAVLRARALSKIKPPLSPEQIEKVKNPPPFNSFSDRIRPVRRADGAPAGPRDEHDLPAKSKAEK